MVILALGFAAFATRITSRRRDQEARLLKLRGMRGLQIFVFLLVELGIVTSLSIGIGLVVCLPYIPLLTTSDGLLSLRNTSLPVILSLQTVLFVGILVIVCILVINIVGLIRVTRQSLIPQQATEEPSEPPWRLLLLDVLFLLLGCAGVLLLVVSNLPVFSYDLVLTMLLGFIGFLIPLCFLLGVILTPGRILPRITNRVSTLFWKTPVSIVGVGLKELPYHTGSPTQAAVLIGMALTVVIFSLTIPGTTLVNHQETTRYNLGGNLVIHDVPQNITWTEFILNINGIEAITSVTTVRLSHPSGQMTYDVTGINPKTFLSAGYLRSDFFGGLPPSILLKNLENTPSGILLWDENIQAFELVPGESLVIGMSRVNTTTGDRENFIGNLQVLGGFALWPRVINYPEALRLDPLHELKIVTSESNLAELLGGSISTSRDVYCHINQSPEIVVNNILSQTNFTVSYVEENLHEFVSSATWRVYVTVLNSNIVLGFIIAGAVLLTYLFSQTRELWNELSIHRALGMKRKQVAFLTGTQGGAILGFAVPLGLVVGVIMSFIFVALLRRLSIGFPSSLPPPLLVIPWDLIIIVSTGILGVGVLGVMITMIRVARLSVAAIWKVE